MPLILAVEPDRSQAHQVTAVIRGRLRAELVLGDSAEAALAALGDRVPDLILTSTLLSAKDESALAEWQRKGAAGHVQTLTIPLLAAPAPRPTPGRTGIFSLRADRESSPSLPERCDPGVFAEQCSAYLDHATKREPGDADDREAAAAGATGTEAMPDEPAADTEETFPAQPPPRVHEPIEEGAEIDLSAMLDESVFQQLSEAIETVSRDSSRPEAAESSNGEAWTPSSLGSPAVWPGLDSRPVTPPARSAGSGRTSAPSKRLPARKPIQDEWGFFDPNQCGFSALLARLDEITHMASPLPAPNPPAGPSDVNR